MTSTSHDLATVDLGGAVLGEMLRASNKSLLALGQRNGLPVVIKALRTDEELWQAKFTHEIRLYQAFTDNPPPVRVPRLVHTDGHSVLVIEHIPGRPVDAERYPEQPLPAATLDTVLDTVTAFAGWTPPPGVLAPVFDYPDRVERYHRAGFFDAVEALVGETEIEVPFLINQAMVLSRELRLHTELPESEFRARRLALLHPQWDAFRTRLHTRR